MKTQQSSILIFLFFIIMISCTDNKSTENYLSKVLKNLEKIESASYTAFIEAWPPGDTIPAFTNYRYIKEYINPADSTIGASYVSLDYDDTTKLDFGYDGNIRVLIYHGHKGLVIDDFKSEAAKRFPYRPVTPPFFSFTKNIIWYALNTNDSITIDLQDAGKEYYFKLTIYEDRQVEFHGKAQYTPDNSHIYGETTSIYELWINKSDDLPYKVRREMSHDISVTTCIDPEFNKLSIADFNLYSYFPEDYEIRKYGEKKNDYSISEAVNKKAPDWTLNDMHEQSVSLADIKSKVVLINFTGIGCGPCKLAIPFLNRLKEKYSTDEFELIAIESWGGKPHSLQNYTNRNNINYKLLSATDEILEEYQTGRGVPTFFVLDKDRIIRKAIRGYGNETTDKEIINAIDELLNR